MLHDDDFTDTTIDYDPDVYCHHCSRYFGAESSIADSAVEYFEDLDGHLCASCIAAGWAS